jgi:AbrB family looped-hinge helix DNA binding protein
MYHLTSKKEGLDMASIATTKLSSKGQVVIPEEVREALGLEAGAQFVVMGDGDVVLLKRIDAPTRHEFRALADRARRQARRAGMKRADIRKVVSTVRRRG